jgi:hypothetical protein
MVVEAMGSRPSPEGPMRSSTWKSFASFPVLALGLLGAATATGCGGCEDSTLICDDLGENCEVCDGYGCNPADPHQPGVTTAASGSTGQGGSTSTGTGGGTTGTGGSACDDEVTTCGCETSDDCSADLDCVGGLCVDGCDFSYECGAGNVCANGACVPGCDDAADCGAGYTCDLDKGICVVDPANPECSDTIDLPPCPEAQECENGLCVTPCTTNAECPAGEICDATAGHCVDDPSPQPVCGGEVQCTGVGQVCMDDGYCHYPCTDVNECKLIDSRFVACEASTCKTEEEVDPECSVNDPCPDGQDCISNTCI